MLDIRQDQCANRAATILRLSVGALVLFALNGCAPSSAPEIQEIVLTRTPTFDGLTYKAYTTSTFDISVTGECDPVSFGLEISTDGQVWKSFARDCKSGSFTVPLHVTKITKLYVRALTQTGQTPSAEAFVRFLLPPTSPLYNFAASSQSGDAGTGALATQNVMGLSFTGIPMMSATHKMQLYLPGVVYAP